jgi:exopolysaccharide production protein ExoY
MRTLKHGMCEVHVVAACSNRPVGGFVKRAFDVITALVFIAVSAPLWISCGLLLLTTGRPVLFRQRRIGFGAREFTCLKFRTMAIDAQDRLDKHLAENRDARKEWQQCHKLRKDPRVTTLGRVMRRTSVDELPQLLNVLKGDMSLVGPRPIVADEVAKYQENFRHYASARPGLTGLWQVNGRNSTTYSQRVAYDVEYLGNWSLMRDIKIIVVTVAHVLEGRGAY